MLRRKEHIRYIEYVKGLQDFKLCYVDDEFAYFTTKPLTEQWGDDWNDVPYEHNAGTPYKDEGMEIMKLAYSADMETPREGYNNSPFSVEVINSGAIAWLRSSTWSKVKVEIQAGALTRKTGELIPKDLKI